MRNQITITLLLIILLLSGCMNQPNNVARNEEDNRIIHVKDSSNRQVDQKTGQEVSRHLVEIATRIPNVNDATAVVIGPYAVVGIDVNSELDRSRVSTIKYSVAESLKKDPYGASAVIIADADTYVRLQEMGRDIQRGRPVAGILEELAEIVGRVMPEIPLDLKEPADPNPTEENNPQMPEDEARELEEKQQEQSNHYKKEERNKKVRN
ncbi:MAG: YhcN/YlaJ family sporulation lipoprotein [Bacillaceae bacterium]|nr:YhcN/YlaJ family sporulation lipoprotein [Bacillaceae bacterium]